MFLIEAYLDNGPHQAKWLSDEQKATVEHHIAEEEREKIEHPSLLALFSDKRVWHMSAIYFAFVMGQYGITFWLPTLIKSAGVEGVNIGLLTAILHRRRGDDAAGGRKRRSHAGAPLAFGGPVSGRRVRPDGQCLRCAEYRPRAPRSVSCRGWHYHLRAPVLVPADRLSRRHFSRSRHRHFLRPTSAVRSAFGQDFCWGFRIMHVRTYHEPAGMESVPILWPISTRSHAWSTSFAVRYSPKRRISLVLSTRKVSDG